MLSVPAEGALTAAPVQMRCTADDGESVFVSVIAFQAEAADALAQLRAGDTVAVAGPACLSRWEKNGAQRVGLKVTATRVLTAYDAGMRRRAASQAHDQGAGAARPDEGDGAARLVRRGGPSRQPSRPEQGLPDGGDWAV